MDKVRLDELVLQNCASLLDFKSRIGLERVSRLFGSVLRSANAASIISLTIGQDDVLSTKEEIQQVIIAITSGSRRAEWSVLAPENPMDSLTQQGIHSLKRRKCHNEITSNVQENFLPSSNASIRYERQGIERILFEIFSRFTRVRCLNFCSAAEWVRFAVAIVLENMVTEQCRKLLVKQLAYKPGRYWNRSPHTNEISESDSRLVEVLAPTLKRFIILHGKIPREGTDLSKRFWTALSTCSSLKKLYLCRICDGPDLFLNTDIRDCLKSLNISEFHAYGNSEPNFNAEWIVESFKSSSKLQKLFINPAHISILEQLATSALLAVIGRLRSIELSIITHELNDINSDAPSICKIVRALPEKGFVNVEHVIFNYETRAAEEEHMISALAFWIRLSDETRKPITLYLRAFRGHGNPVAISRQSVDDLNKQAEFTDIKSQHHADRTIVQFNHARVTLFFKLLTWKPYLTAEFSCEHHVE